MSEVDTSWVEFEGDEDPTPDLTTKIEISISYPGAGASPAERSAKRRRLGKRVILSDEEVTFSRSVVDPVQRQLLYVVDWVLEQYRNDRNESKS